ncbi:MAG: hypothetical protein ABI895_07770 [Deltaproteobacteria bacterium]
MLSLLHAELELAVLRRALYEQVHTGDAGALEPLDRAGAVRKRERLDLPEPPAIARPARNVSGRGLLTGRNQRGADLDAVHAHLLEQVLGDEPLLVGAKRYIGRLFPIAKRRVHELDTDQSRERGGVALHLGLRRVLEAS